MTNREYYNMMQHEKKKYDKLKKALYNIRAEIIEHQRKTQPVDPLDLVGDCLEILNKHILEMGEDLVD